MEVNNLCISDNQLSPIHLNIKTPLCCSTKTQYIPNKYSIIAQHLAILTFVKKVNYKLLTYNEALESPESAK